MILIMATFLEHCLQSRDLVKVDFRELFININDRNSLTSLNIDRDYFGSDSSTLEYETKLVLNIRKIKRTLEETK